MNQFMDIGVIFGGYFFIFYVLRLYLKKEIFIEHRADQNKEKNFL